MPNDSNSPPPSKRRIRRIPNYAMYGDNAPAGGTNMFNFEWIPERSSQYEWEINAHEHQSLIQILYMTEGQGHTLLDDVRAEQADLLQELRPSTHRHRRPCWHWMVRMTLTTARSLSRLRRRAMPASGTLRSVASGGHAAPAASMMRR